MVERQKTKAIAIKRYKNRGEISLFSREERNYEINTRDDIDLDQAKDEYPLKL